MQLQKNYLHTLPESETMRTFLIRILVVMAAVLTSAAITSCVYDDPKQEEFELAPGDRIPDFSVKMNDGRTVTGESLRHGAALIMFFHSDCPDCRGTLPSVQKLYDQYDGNGVSFALISRGELAEPINAYWEEQGYNMPFSAQPDRKIYTLFASSRVPRVYVCKDGIILSAYHDDPIPTYEELYRDILLAL